MAQDGCAVDGGWGLGERQNLSRSGLRKEFEVVSGNGLFGQVFFRESGYAEGKSVRVRMVVPDGVCYASGSGWQNGVAAFPGDQLSREHLDQWKEGCWRERRRWHVQDL